MAKIAILGFGTVGSGVLEVLRTNADKAARRAGQPVEVKYICDIRDFSSHPDAALFVKTLDPILNDPEVTAVVAVSYTHLDVYKRQPRDRHRRSRRPTGCCPGPERRFSCSCRTGF